jgi:protease PrsW
VSAPPGLPLAPASARAMHFRSRGLRIVLGALLVLLGLIALLAVDVEVGPAAFLTGLVLAALPVPVYVTLALRIDRYEPEPARLLAWAFFWGATGAIFIALVLNTAGQAVVGSHFGSDVGDLYGGSISAPVVEESAKGAVLFAIWRWRRWQIDGVLDGIVYAAMVGLGFAMTENVLYYGHAAATGGIPLGVTFFARGVTAPFAHPVFTSMTGIGLGVAVTTHRPWMRRLAPVAGLLAAMALHSLWNTSSSVGGGAAFLGVYFLIMVPVFVCVVVVALVSLRREGRVVAERLRPEVETELLNQADVIGLASLRDRRRLRRAARRDGREAKRALEALQMAATEVAFRRDRLARGLPVQQPGADPEAALAAAAATVRDAQGPALSAARADLERRAAWRAPGVATTGHWPAGSPAPAAWYADPWRQARWRWWDGTQWTGHVAN